MKAALIPPIPALREFGTGDFHLLLSHLVEDNRYFKHYRQQRDRGAYLVLDNSAHEAGAGQQADTLAEQAARLNAQEVVVPDVLENGPATVEACLAAMEAWYEQGWSPIRELDPTLMYVPQGKDLNDWEQCLHELTRIHHFTARRYKLRDDFVIGLSKDYESWDGGLRMLLAEYLDPLRCQLGRKRMRVHLLGWGRELWNLGNLAHEFPWVRSTDSAKPFVYALAGIRLNMLDDPPEYPRRPPRYFSRRLGPSATETARKNVETFRACAMGAVAVK